MKIYLIVLLFLLISGVSAIVVPVIVPMDNSPARGEGQCTPPIEYAKNNDCTLNFYSKYSVNKFTCGNKILYGDCRGSYYKSEKISNFNTDTIMIILVILSSVAILYIAIRIMKGG